MLILWAEFKAVSKVTYSNCVIYFWKKKRHINEKFWPLHYPRADTGFNMKLHSKLCPAYKYTYKHT